MQIPSDVVYHFLDGHGFIIPGVKSDNMFASINGEALLTYSYLKNNNFFNKQLSLRHSWDKNIVIVSFQILATKMQKNDRLIDTGSMIVNGEKANYFISYA